MTVPKGSWTPQPDQFEPGSWGVIQRLGWRPGEVTARKKTPDEIIREEFMRRYKEWKRAEDQAQNELLRRIIRGDL